MYNYNQDLEQKVLAIAKRRRLKKLDEALASYWSGD